MRLVRRSHGSSPSAHCTERAGPGCEAMGQEGDQEGQEKVQKLHYGKNIQKTDCIYFKNKSELEGQVPEVRGKVLGRAGKAKGPLNKLMEVLQSGQYEIPEVIA